MTGSVDRQRDNSIGLAVLLIATIAVTTTLSAQDTQREPNHNLPTPNRYWFLEPRIPFLASKSSSSMEPIFLELTTPTQKVIKLKIPRAYISAVDDSSKTTQTFINLAVYLPDYLPRVLAEKAGHRIRGEVVNGIELHNKAEIGIQIKTTRAGADFRNIEWIKSHSIPAGKFSDEFEIYYRKKGQGGKIIPNMNSGHLIPAGQNNIVIDFAASPATREMIGCDMWFHFNDDLALRVSFSAKHLGHYTEIRKAVSKLMNQFLK